MFGMPSVLSWHAVAPQRCRFGHAKGTRVCKGHASLGVAVLWCQQEAHAVLEGVLLPGMLSCWGHSLGA